jgi:ribosome-binding protein aMBF1 (putative translation factor)
MPSGNPDGLRAKYPSEYSAWANMKQRCLNILHPQYNEYGGRGIYVCQEWIESFKTFIDDMGPKPSKEYMLERKDNNGGYEPNNCKWATMAEQAHNTRKTILSETKVYIIRELYKKGMKQSELAEMFNVPESNISMIINLKTWKE